MSITAKSSPFDPKEKAYSEDESLRSLIQQKHTVAVMTKRSMIMTIAAAAEVEKTRKVPTYSYI